MLREPLLHFLVGGIGLFLLFSYVADVEQGGDDQIVVTAGQIEHFVTLFVKTRQRVPSDVELRGIIDDFILEEIFYREAIAIGLDQDDTIIRRRLRQKFEFLLDDFTLVEPSDADLQQLLDRQPERFRRDDRITFEQVYLGDDPKDVAVSVLEQLQAGEPDPGRFAVSYLIEFQFEDALTSAVSARFGDAFVAEISALQIGTWSGPVQSPFGLHLIRVDQLIHGAVPTLADIRATVEREWLVDFRAVAQQEIIDRMKANYTVTIEQYDMQSR